MPQQTTSPSRASRGRSAQLPLRGVHVPALDGVRGIAIALVMIYHFTFYGGVSWGPFVDRQYYRIATTGWFGVDLFFVLSGFLITGILFDTRRSPHYFRQFFVRRTLRIFPLYYGFLALLFVMAPALVTLGEEFEAFRAQQFWYWSYLVNLDVALHGWPDFKYLGHFWSLAVEEQFYLFWPVVVLTLRRRALVWSCVALVFAAPAFRLGLWVLGNPPAAYVLTPARMDALAVGAWIALWFRGGNRVEDLRRWAGPVLCVCGAGLGTIFLWKRRLSIVDGSTLTIGLTLLALAFGALLVIAVSASPESRSGRFFTHPALRWLGRYSYALYVFHHPVILYMRSQGFTAGQLPAVAGSHLFGQLVVICVATAVSTALAVLSWWLWESRFLRLKSRFPYAG